MQVFDADASRERLPLAALIPTLRTWFAAGCEAPLRQILPITEPAGAGSVLLMPAWRPGRRFGLKTATVFPGNAAQGRPTVQSVYLLFDATTGTPLAQLDGNEITARRTAAASALAASFLARADASRLAIVGAGRVARLLAPAMRLVRPIDRVTVWNRSRAGAQALVDSLRTDGFDTDVADDLEAAVRAAQVVSCATVSEQPLVRGDWLAPGTHLDLIGSFTPAMREADVACVGRSRVFVDTDEALAKAGELVDAQRAGVFAPAQRVATLAMLCRGEHPGREGHDEITLFKSVGNALEDLAAAELVFDAPAPPRTVRLYWEDFVPGTERDFGAVPVSRDAVLSFARAFDPQAFHLDDAAAARSLFGRLSASGWHTCALAMRMMCDDYLLESSSLGSPGIDSLRWLKPVYPGDTLGVRFTVLESRPMASRPGVGLVRSRWELHNQHGDAVMTMEGWGMFGRRPQAAA
jgi:ornithine cyclodeaminase